MPRFTLLVRLLLLTLFVSSCGSSNDYVMTGTPAPVNGPASGIISVRHVLQRAVPNSIVTFRFTGLDSTGRLQFGPLSVVKAPTVTLSPVPVGVTELVIEYLDIQGEVVAIGSNPVVVVAGQVTILDDPSFQDVESAVTSLQVTPAIGTIPDGAGQQFSAIAFFANGEQADLTSSVIWTSSAPATATIDPRGLATAVDPGSTTITATLGNVTGNASLNVTAARLDSLIISPASPTLPLGRTTRFTVNGTFSDGTQADLSNSVTWTSASPNVATITSDGLATAVNVGSTVIGASLNGVDTSTMLTATSAVLTSIDVTPASPSLTVGQSLQFTATGTFSDGTSQALTTGLTWRSTDPAVASINGSGLAVGLSGGQTAISVTDASTGAAAEVILVTIPRVVLTKIDITPASSTLFPGQTQAFTATGTYSNGTTANVTSTVTWTSADPAIATVNATGTVTAIAMGTTTVTATLSGLNATVSINVRDAFLFVTNTQGSGWSRFLANLPLTGNVAPLNQVTGFRVTPTTPEGIDYDPVNGEVWIGGQSDNFVSVYDIGASGNTAPKRSFGTNGNSRGVVYDQGRDLLYVTSGGTLQIFTNPRAFNGGTPAATRQVTGFASTYGIFLDRTSDRLYLIESTGLSRLFILDNASTLNGDISTIPFRQVQGLSSPRGVTVDLLRDIAYVSTDSNIVYSFANASTTNLPASPTATISGPNTRLGADNDGVTIDPEQDELYVSCGGIDNRICIFVGASTLRGSNDSAPSRVIEGPATGFNGPGGLFFCRP